jgi:transcriptional regulator with XRE-family HTH domain
MMPRNEVEQAMIDLGVIDYRLLATAELAAVIHELRKQRGWTQETLAELARVSTRTIQRLEEGLQSSMETRRAVAGAFGYDNLDILNKPWPLPNIEKLKEKSARIERETVGVDVVPLGKGRRLRELAEQGHSCLITSLDEPEEEIEALMAELQQYFVDYGDCHDLYSATDKLDVNRHFQEWIDQLAAKGVGLVGGLRRVPLRSNNRPNDPGSLFNCVYVVSGPIDALPATIRVPRNTTLGL